MSLSERINQAQQAATQSGESSAGGKRRTRLSPSTDLATSGQVHDSLFERPALGFSRRRMRISF